MARLATLFVTLAFVVFASCEEERIQQLKGIPYVVESNLPSTLNNVALSAAQNVLDSAPNLISAAQQLSQKVSNYDRSLKFNVAIEPAAYKFSSDYFAHYVVNNYNVYLYSVKCHY